MSSEKKQKLQALLDAFKTLPTDAQVDNAVDRFNTYWPFFKTGLEFLESRGFTGKKRDAQIEALIAEGDKLKNDPALASKITDFVDKLEKAWERIRGVIEFLIGLPVTGEKFDEAMTKFVHIGDEFTGYKED